MRILGYIVVGYIVLIAVALVVGWAIGEMSGTDTPKQPPP